MIVGFRDEALRAFFLEDVPSIDMPADFESRLFRAFQMIDDAATDRDLRRLPGNHFEQPSGPLAGRFSIRVNAEWRLIFWWDGDLGEASDLHLEAHSDR